MNILCFHIPSSDWPTARQYWRWYQLMVASLTKVHDGAKFILITHENAEVPSDIWVDAVLRIPADIAPPNHLHLLRVYGWVAYTGSDFFDDDTISVDTDILFQQDPRPAFDDEFDVGLTYECIQKSHWADTGKINSGVMFLRPANSDRVEKFFAGFFEKLLEMKDQPDRRFIWGDRSPTLKEWGGDEIALMALFDEGALASPDQASKMLILDGLRIKTFPSRSWNCQICNESDDALMMPFFGRCGYPTLQRPAKGIDGDLCRTPSGHPI